MTDEKDNLIEALKRCADDRGEMVESLFDDLAFMREKFEDLREVIQDMMVIVNEIINRRK